MLHCLQAPEKVPGKVTELTVLERQRAWLKWQQQQQTQQPQRNYLNDTQFNEGTQVQQLQALILQEQTNPSMACNPGLENAWPDFNKFMTTSTGFPEVITRLAPSGSGFPTSYLEMDYSLCRTSSCPPAMAAAGANEVVAPEQSRESVLTEKMAFAIGKESFRKRKQDKARNTKVFATEEPKDKRVKGEAEEVVSKVTDQNNSNNNNNRETSTDTSKENSKASEVQKPDYIHVRARRGQATDSHSLAERVRREKISERMKYLQDLVPGCNKITGKAGMLDEIINYVQSLQRQVEFLSMKLAAVNPRFNFSIDNFFMKEMFPACSSVTPVSISSDMANPAYLNPLEAIVSCGGLGMTINSPDMGLQRSTGAPVSISETFFDTSCFTQPQASSTLETDLQNLYNMEFYQGRSMPFPYQSFAGNLEDNNLKMEM